MLELTNMGYLKNTGVWKVSSKRKRKKKTLKQMRDRLNDQSIRIKQISREVFKEADIGTRKHKDKKKYNRKLKYKKDWKDEIQERE